MTKNWGKRFWVWMSIAVFGAFSANAKMINPIELKNIQEQSQTCTELWNPEQTVIATLETKLIAVLKTFKDGKKKYVYEVQKNARILTRSRSLSAVNFTSEEPVYGEALITRTQVDDWLYLQNVHHILEGNDFKFNRSSNMIPEGTVFEYQTQEGQSCECKVFGPTVDNKDRAESSRLYDEKNAAQYKEPMYNRLFCMPKEAIEASGQNIDQFFFALNPETTSENLVNVIKSSN